ncbi:MAG TPA: glycerol kinase GlpK [Thermomicrobiales bacterium]|nr:glycerol kinase GlpK [Thermomicrobiales bacterium]
MTGAILALDQGTTSSRAMLVGPDGTVTASANAEFRQHYPRPGWVEHDPDDIIGSQFTAAREALATLEDSQSVAAIGIANQRETTLLWDRRDGRPVHNAIVWQDRRTTGLCDALRSAGWEEEIRSRTGLVIDPYFSATKVRWLLDAVPGLRGRAERGEIAFGTVDSFLIYTLTGGRLHVTDVSNASRTMLFNLQTLDWDDDILRELRIPRALLPEVRASSGVIGVTDLEVFGSEIPISGIAGDQQAATFGQACFTPGMSKQTFGTGSFMLMNTGERQVTSQHGLLTTIGWQIGGETTYALEGSSFIAGAAVQWLRDALGIIGSAAESASLAASVESSGGVYFVPAFVGLGAPYWDPNARGALLGLTRGTGRAEIARAVLEAVAFQTRDLATAMEADCGMELSDLRVDGGMVANDVLMQIQADTLGCSVTRPAVIETTGMGAAFLAGLAVGIWHDTADIERIWQLDRQFVPVKNSAQRDREYHGWLRAVERSRNWATDDE